MLRADLKITPEDGKDDALRKLRSAVLGASGDAAEDSEAIARRIAVVAGLERVEDALSGTAGSELGQELRWGVRRYFEQRAADAPLTLIFDDIHWAEDAMLEMIEHLAEWSTAPLFILCLARPELRDRRATWGGGLMNAGAVRLEPLNASETRRLIAALLAIDDLPERLRETITERAHGNPLYVEETLRMLIDGGHIEKRDERWVASSTAGDVAVPATLQGLLAARRAFRAEERDAGNKLYARARTIADAIGAPLAERVEATAYAAVARGRVEGETAAGSDFDAALALARTNGPSEPLARLLIARGWGPRVDVSGMASAFAEAAAVARSLGDHDLTVEAMIGTVRPVWWVGDVAAAQEMVAGVRRYAVTHGSTRHLGSIAVWERVLAEALGDFDALERSCALSVEAAQAHESKIERSLTPTLTAVVLARARGDLDQELAATRKWVELVPALGLPGIAAYSDLGRCLVKDERYDEAIKALLESIRRGEQRGTHRGVIGEQRQVLARAQVGAGRLAEASASAERAYNEVGADDPYSRSTTAVALAMVRAAEGNEAEADRLYREGIAVTKGYRDRAVDASIEYARFLLERGRPAEARPLLEQARAFFAHPMVAKRRERIEQLLKRCDEVRAT